jgi:ribonuclease PH
MRRSVVSIHRSRPASLRSARSSLADPAAPVSPDPSASAALDSAPLLSSTRFSSTRFSSTRSGYVATAEGSVLIETGNTRVLCNATIETGVPGWMRNSGRGWVTAEYGMLPRATLTRTPRESERGKVGGRTHEIQRLIGRSLRAVVDMKALGERTVILDCDVLQADGGTRTAAITGASVALGHRARQAGRRRHAQESPSAPDARRHLGRHRRRQHPARPRYEEDSRADVDMNVVMLADGGLVETQATAEKRVSYTRAQLTAMLDLAEGGLKQIFAAQRAVLGRS